MWYFAVKHLDDDEAHLHTHLKLDYTINDSLKPFCIIWPARVRHSLKSRGQHIASVWMHTDLLSLTPPPYTNKTHTVLKKFSLTPSEKLTLTLHCNSDWLCKQLKCEISQRLSRKPFDTLKKIRRDYTSLGGLSKTVNFAFQTTRVGGFFFFKQAWGKPLKREKFCIFSDSSKTLDIFSLNFFLLLIHTKRTILTVGSTVHLHLSISALPLWPWKNSQSTLKHSLIFPPLSVILSLHNQAQ